MTVSVVMPVHDGADFVAEAVASVQRQRGVDFELLVHDDGSTDRTAEVLRALADEDERILVSSGSTCGPAASRNRLLARARGEYVAFLDHDDLWPDPRLARQLGLLDAAPEAPGVLGETLLFESLDRGGRPLRTPGFRRVLTGLLQAGLFRRAAVLAVGGFDPGLTVADDFDFLLRVVETCGPLLVESEVSAWYRLHPGQRTGDREVTGAGTARALGRSLRRRRALAGARAEGLEWRARP
jgi:glycosyltransferase involved in cell wall biosynthesis